MTTTDLAPFESIAEAFSCEFCHTTWDRGQIVLRIEPIGGTQ